MAKLITGMDSHWVAVQLQSNSRLPGRHSKSHHSQKERENKTRFVLLFFLHIITHIVRASDDPRWWPPSQVLARSQGKGQLFGLLFFSKFFLKLVEFFWSLFNFMYGYHEHNNVYWNLCLINLNYFWKQETI